MDPRTRHADDRRFVERVLAGDQAETARFVERMACVPAILRVRLRRSSLRLSAEEFEEVVQSVLTAIWSKLSTFGGGSTLETWAYGFCANELLKARDRRLRDGRMVNGEGGDPPAPPATEERDRLAFDYIHEAVDRLGLPAAEVVRLKHFESLTFTEIGERLEMSPNTAKTLYYRGVRKLRETLRPHLRESS